MRQYISIRRIFGRFNSIQSAMMVSFSAIMLIAMLLFLVISLTHTRTAVFENSIAYQTTIIEQVNDEIDSYISYMENISGIAARNVDVLNYLYQENQSAEELAAGREKVLALYRTVMDSRDDISTIAAIGDHGQYIINDGNDKLNPYIDVQGLPWYQAALHSDSSIAVSSSHVQNAIKDSYRWVITLSRALVNGQTGKPEGVFLIDLNYSAISRLCNARSASSKGYIFILDGQGNIVYHPKQQLLYGGLLAENISGIMAAEGGYLIEKSEQGEIIYTKSRSEKTGWIVVGATFTSELIGNITANRLRYLGAVVVLLLAVIAISLIISREIARPIRQLKSAMALAQNGEFKKANVNITTNNEIGRLNGSFNQMTERIDSLLQQNIKEQEEKRRTELKALQSQINPHFLYNTLDSIIWMSEVGRNEEVVLMTSALARLFRQSISNNQEQVRIREELDYVKNYLIIQQMRYQDKLDYEIAVQSEILEERIIKFVLQPLVENAIYHGIKYKKTRGRLRIEGCLEGQMVVIQVSDDGVGMDEDTVRTIFNEKSREKPRASGIGIGNVQKRIKLCYGDEYGILYTSVKGQGTVATVRIPVGKEVK